MQLPAGLYLSANITYNDLLNFFQSKWTTFVLRSFENKLALSISSIFDFSSFTVVLTASKSVRESTIQPNKQARNQLLVSDDDTAL